MTEIIDEEARINKHPQEVQKVLRKYKAIKEKSAQLPKVILKRVEDGTAHMSIPDEASTLGFIGMFGTDSQDFASTNFHLTTVACFSDTASKTLQQREIDTLVAAIAGIDAQDELEGMLATQMVATHFAAMRQLQQTKNSERINQQDSNGNLAIKLMRTFTTQLEALQKYRGKGQQKMTVEHVHVNAGGQAIIGNVNNDGGSQNRKTEEQPHATAVNND